MNYISFSNLSYKLPDGTILFSDLNGLFSGKTSIIGNNGAGKSILAKIISGILLPASGSIITNSILYYMPQYSAPESVSIAEYLNISDKLDALKRIESGEVSQELYDTLDGYWDINEKVSFALHKTGISYLSTSVNMKTLSGGEYTKLALTKAYLSGCNFLVLDEPTNHMDAESTDILINELYAWNGGLLLISHNRKLLNITDTTIELENGKIYAYGGNFDFYKEQKIIQQNALEQKLGNIKSEFKREKQKLAAKIDNQNKKNATGKKNRDSSGLPKIVMGRHKDNSEKSSSKLKEKWNDKLDKIKQEKQQLAEQVNSYKTNLLFIEKTNLHNKVVFELNNVKLPYGCDSIFNYKAIGPERIAVTGKNGCGKSTLLSVLTGNLKAAAGTTSIHVDYFYLNQTFTLTDISALEIIKQSTSKPEGLIREAMSHINLKGDRAKLPFSKLSGGEKLKLSLLAGLMKDPVPQLIILDEPTNHMDLKSIIALEEMLNSYDGCIIVISHDTTFLQAINITSTINLT